MTKNEIIRIAREACAKVYEELAENAKNAMTLRLQQIASAIRARGQA